MNFRHSKLYSPVLVGITVLQLLASSVTARVPLPIITNAQVDVPNRHLLINGTAFGSLRFDAEGQCVVPATMQAQGFPYRGMPMRRSRSSNRGSERSGSATASTLR